MGRPPPRAIRSIPMLLVAAVWAVLSGWVSPHSIAQQRELTSARTVDSGDPRPALGRRFVATPNDRTTNPAADEPSVLVPLRVAVHLLPVARPIGLAVPPSLGRRAAVARGPPTSRV